MKAKPIEDCLYPRCEECSKYQNGYCTVPIVVSRQIYHLLADKIDAMDNSIAELEKLVMDEILGEEEEDEDEPCVLTEEEYNSLTPMQKFWYDKRLQQELKAAALLDSLNTNKGKGEEGETIKIRKFAPLDDFTEKLP